MANPSKIASKKKQKSGKKACPECDSEMDMSRVMRTEGPSGMFWVCSDYNCGAVVSKEGVQVESLELR